MDKSITVKAFVESNFTDRNAAAKHFDISIFQLNNMISQKRELIELADSRFILRSSKSLITISNIANLFMLNLISGIINVHN